MGSDEKTETGKEAGADAVLTYRKERFCEAVNQLTGGKGVDVILDPMGGEIFNESLKCLAMFGRIVNFNNASGVGGAIDTRQLHASCRAALGFSLSTTLKHRPEIIRETAQQVLPMLEQKKIRL